jgi:biofilm PGA synthesis lipoprotein PgaB
MKSTVLFIVAAALMAATVCGAEQPLNPLINLCYHDVPKEVKLDDFGVDQASFIDQIEYLRSHGYNFLSLDEVIEASKGRIPWPKNAVLLSFDDAYLSFYEFVFPILKMYGIPAVLAVETGWIDKPDPSVQLPLMNWEQLKEVAQSKLVSIASHSHDLHHGIVYNPQGNTGWAAAFATYDPKTNTYEGWEDHRRRLREDLQKSKNVLKEKLGVNVRALVWPYGQSNGIGAEEAKSLGYEALFTLEDKVAMVGSDLSLIPRYLLNHNPDILTFIYVLKQRFITPVRQRIVQADLDLIYDADPVQQEKNLDAFIERVFKMKPDIVYLQAFCDDKGDGNVASVYFPNRVLPMKSDLFSRVTNQLFVRGIQVYAWMPMMGIVLPDEAENEALRVKELQKGRTVSSRSWYPRLSPFSNEAREKLAMLYEDLAFKAKISGIVFQDDGYLNDSEDFNSSAIPVYERITGGVNVPYDSLTSDQKKKWMRVKTKTLFDLTETLKEVVRYYRPNALFARTLYAGVVTDPESEEWFGQNYAESLKAYDYTVIMAYPALERVGDPVRWLKRLVEICAAHPQGLEKTVFKVQTYDWAKKRWIGAKIVDQWLRALVAAGAHHVAYYPDDYTVNQPDEKVIRPMMSTEKFAFKRKQFVKDMRLMS